ncbi:MAG: hypothetical protein A2Y33_06395 [Spirochaetes bacterium GWF1_51_8]|nr:MAG: hypothetical protein A2Y33_06395 [Spirochaetes bacterium GWF1_51_8]
MKYLLYIFDIDGTLIDSRSTITQALYDAGAEFGSSRESIERASAMIGQTLDTILNVMGVPDDRLEWGRQVYRKHYFGYIDREKPYPGIAETVRELSGRVLLSVATNKGQNGARRTLENHGLLKYFDYLACADNSPPKPDPGSLTQILEFYAGQGKHLDPSDCLVIGDSPYDAEYASNAGADFALVTWGFFTPENVPFEPDYLISEPKQLIELNDETVTVEITWELDLHSYAPKDVKKTVMNYLDAARENGLRTVKIAHGKGRGVQKEIVRAVLSETPYVLRHYDAPDYLGGFGATIAELDIE